MSQDHNGPMREKNSMDRLQEQIMAWAEEKGWNQGLDEHSFGDWCALITSEISEAYEDYRNHHEIGEVYYEDGTNNGRHYTLADVTNINSIQNRDGDYPTLFKPCGIPIEMADAVIRILHIAEFAGFNLHNMIEMKMRYNQQRAFRHGGKKV